MVSVGDETQAARPSDKAHVREAITIVKSALLEAVVTGRFDDLAFIGNSSALYEWHPCLMVDLDAFLFARSLDEVAGTWLLSCQQTLATRLNDLGIEFQLRIVEGPYKPPVRELSSAIVVAHLGVFTERAYLAVPPLKRWAWRKYLCANEAGRLQRLAPERPTLPEFVHGAKGVAERLHAIEEGRVWMHELVLPTLVERRFAVKIADANFLECCFAHAANCARNHARVLAHTEPDRLGNPEFFPWYHENVFHSIALLQLMEMKSECRARGFRADVMGAQRLALNYLRPLRAHLEKSL